MFIFHSMVKIGENFGRSNYSYNLKQGNTALKAAKWYFNVFQLTSAQKSST